MKRIETSEWKPFKIVDLFNVKNTHSILKSQIEEDSGDTPYVTASNDNNGVYSYISYDEDLKETGNCIMIGGKTLTITYQKKDFYSNDSHNLALYLKDTNFQIEKVYLFIIAALKASIGHSYHWGDSISSRSIQKDIIILPAEQEGKPDFQYMQSYMENLEFKVNSLLSDLQDANQSNVSKISDTTKWGTFHLYDESLFTIDSGTKLDKVKMDTSIEEVAFVGRSNVNNGITTKVKQIEGIEPYKKGNLTLALGGAYLGSCFVQPEDFYTSQNVVVLIPNNDMNYYVKQFIASAIFVESQNNYKAFIKELNAHIKRDFKIKLPIDKNGKPDWDYMIEYMKQIELKANQVLKVAQL